MLTMNDLKVGTYIEYDGAPYEVLEANHVKMQQRRPVMQTRIRNLIDGRVLPITFQTHSEIEAADIERPEIVFLYEHRNEFVFHFPGDKASRFSLRVDIIGDKRLYLKPNLTLRALKFKDNIVNIELPIKMDFKVKEAPPNFKGDTATGGYKEVILETGLKVKAPMFIEEGETIRVNTKSGEYVERVQN